MKLTYYGVLINPPDYFFAKGPTDVGGEYEDFGHNIIINELYANEAEIVNFTSYIYHEMAHATWIVPDVLTEFAFRREMQVRKKQSELSFQNRKVKCCVAGKEITELTDAWDDVLEKCKICSPSPKKCRNIAPCKK